MRLRIVEYNKSHSNCLNLPTAQEIFERILYIWAIRHPASGYVQGINDLVTPFFLVFLEEYCAEGQEVSDLDVAKALTAEQVRTLFAASEEDTSFVPCLA